MLESQPGLVEIGKAYMARNLLQRELNDRQRRMDLGGAWYRTLWGAFDRRSLDAFRRTPLKIVTYNYDRSLEYALVGALQVQFGASDEDCANALDCIGPLHLHGQLGYLSGFPVPHDSIVHYGSSPDEAAPTDSDCLNAARQIRIVHEPNPQEEAFVRARGALASAERIIFLGFGYAPQNVERLQLTTCVNRHAEIFLCVTGFTGEQQMAMIRPYFTPWGHSLRSGAEQDDIVAFFRRFPEALL